MKRTPLLRKTRLKHSNPDEHERAYKALRARQKKDGWVICGETGQTVPYSSREPHHVNRRLGKNVLIFTCISQGLHHWIENHSKKARELGWLRNEGQGYPINRTQPKPWKHCYNEELLNH